MKAISLAQPFASLVALGHKKIDTRGRDTGYRGEVLIHASTVRLESSKFLWDGVLDGYLQAATYNGGPMGAVAASFDGLPFGAIVGNAFLCSTMPVVSLLGGGGSRFTVAGGGHAALEFWLTEKELSLGDYSLDRIAYFLAGAELFPEPIPVKGCAYLWDHDL